MPEEAWDICPPNQVADHVVLADVVREEVYSCEGRFLSKQAGLG